jgi:hypothetical protein
MTAAPVVIRQLSPCGSTRSRHHLTAHGAEVGQARPRFSTPSFPSERARVELLFTFRRHNAVTRPVRREKLTGWAFLHAVAAADETPSVGSGGDGIQR